MIGIAHFAVLTAVVAGKPTAVALPDRIGDPVVLPGLGLPTLSGVQVDEVLAFRYENGWIQIPVQIDERKTVDFAKVYFGPEGPPLGLTTSAYADPTTYTGSDLDPLFDGDDELVFTARDAGGRAIISAAAPGGTIPGSGVEVEIVDPLNAAVAYVYLFEGDGSLAPDAGQDYITYTFNLLAGDYIPNYNSEQGPNPEDSVVASGYYQTHFADRWIRDELRIFGGSATGIDILDRHTNLFGPDNCHRSEDVFCQHEGAFFTNKDGPVRAIRSYVGASSGPLTQREHLFYERRQDITTFLRVHEIPGIMDLYDYSPDAVGMYYYNDLNPAGVLVDGLNDGVLAGPISWEMVTGPQGALVSVLAIETDIAPFAYASFYSDTTEPDPPPCTGDEFEYGKSGLWVDTAIPNTDPLFGTFNTLTGRRTVYYDAPGQTVAAAALRAEQARHPLQAATRPYPRYRGDYDGNCRIDLDDYAALVICLHGPDDCPAEECAVFDWDGDGQVTLADFASFQNTFTGTEVSLPGCWVSMPFVGKSVSRRETPLCPPLARGDIGGSAPRVAALSPFVVSTPGDRHRIPLTLPSGMRVSRICSAERSSGGATGCSHGREPCCYPYLEYCPIGAGENSPAIQGLSI